MVNRIVRDLTDAQFARSIKAVDALTSAEALAELRPGGTIVLDPALVRPSTGLRFTIVRPADLLSLDLVAIGLTLESRDAGPVLLAGAKAGTLSVRLAWQHLGEAATPEANDADLGPTPTPVPARAARRSRLVFDVPPGTAIAYSIEGILEAMTRLEMRVVPLAKPRATGWTFPVDLPPISIGSGYALHEIDGQIVIGAAANFTAAAGSTRVRTLIQVARADREATVRLASASPLDLRSARRTAASGERRPVGKAVLGSLFEPYKPGRGRTPTARAPKDDETAIEAPFRLTLSPSVLEGWTHAAAPVASTSDPDRIELWHTRLGVRVIDARDGAVVSIDERANPQRIVRAVWARELELPPPLRAEHAADPFPPPLRGSLSDHDRITLVGQSTRPSASGVPARPVEARTLMLSSLGAWLEVDAVWAKATVDALDLPKTITAWKHVAPMGRDQFVRVDVPGYLYPFGHEAVLVTITERKIKSVTDPQARLYQRKFILVSEPVKRYTHHDLPLSEVRIAPLVTPDLTLDMPSPPANETLFWPNVDGKPFLWKLHALDRGGRPVQFEAPLLFVGTKIANKAHAQSAYQARESVPFDGQQVAFAPPANPGDTANEARTISFFGSFSGQVPVPHMKSAEIVVPAMRHLTPAAPPSLVSYPDSYIASGFGGANKGEVYLKLAAPSAIAFDSTERSGGFIKPNVNMAGLSRAIGIAGDLGSVEAGKFDPVAFLGSAMPKLFGMIDLVELLLPDDALDRAPKFLTEALDGISALLADIAELQQAVTALSSLSTELQALAASVEAQANAAIEKIGKLLTDIEASSEDAAAAALQGDFGALVDLVRDVRDAAMANAALLSPAARARLERLTGSVLQVLEDADALTRTVRQAIAFARGFDPGDLSVRAHLEWRPKIKSWKSVFLAPPAPNDHLTLSVDVRASGKGEAGIDILASLEKFSIQLLPGQPLMRFHFDRMAFRAGSSRKPEVDIVFGGIEFVGLLSFIEVLRDLIPLDGFSDPPFLDVSPQGVSAGFTVALPNVAIGVFSLTNISLGADARIPFLGASPVDIGFNFCTRERPFTLAVAFLGGGGFFSLRASPSGLELLEMALEFGAVVALNFGVASGSVSAMGGVYLRLEGDAGSLTGYFRVRGEVDVLGLISASIELYMALAYEFSTGKMVGQASITVCIEVLFISKSVKISCERRFAGSNGDPTVRDMLVAPDGTTTAWTDYCQAFADA
jgi:hypothetical protein